MEIKTPPPLTNRAETAQEAVKGVDKATLWLSVSESAAVSGLSDKTIRRAISAARVLYKVSGERYYIDFSSLLSFLHSNTKLKNKLDNEGIGQYVKEWKK